MTWSINKKRVSKEKLLNIGSQEVLPNVIVKKSPMTKNSEKGSQFIAKRQFRNLLGLKTVNFSIVDSLKFLTVILYLLKFTTSIQHGKDLLRNGKVSVNGQFVYINRIINKYDVIEIHDIQEDSIIKQSYINNYNIPMYIKKIGINKGLMVGEPKLEEIQLPKNISKIALERYRGK